LSRVASEKLVVPSSVKSDAKGIAQPKGEDLIAPLLADERIVGGNGIRIAAVYVKAQDAAQKGGVILPIAKGWMTDAYIVGPAPIPEWHIEVSIRPKDDLTAVVIRLRLINLQQDPL
jgi:hypothetical protein